MAMSPIYITGDGKHFVEPLALAFGIAKGFGLPVAIRARAENKELQPDVTALIGAAKYVVVVSTGKPGRMMEQEMTFAAMKGKTIIVLGYGERCAPPEPLLPGVAYFDLWETNTAAAIRHVTEHMRADQSTDALMGVLISLMYLNEP